jgi:hypothetical protein
VRSGGAVILSEAKLQRSGRSPRGQAFNPGLVDQRCFASLNVTELFARDVTSLVGGQTVQTHRGNAEVHHPRRAARSLFA